MRQITQCQKCKRALYTIDAQMNWGGLPNPSESDVFETEDGYLVCEDCFAESEDYYDEFIAEMEHIEQSDYIY